MVRKDGNEIGRGRLEEGRKLSSSLEWGSGVWQNELQGVHKVGQDQVDPRKVLTKEPGGVENDLCQDVAIAGLKGTNGGVIVRLIM